jgi:RNA-directed DNA polymerase
LLPDITHLCLGVALQRWLKASVQIEDGRVVPRQAGMPQGGMISSLLANLFLHYALDKWMAREPPRALCVICRCRTEEGPLWRAIADRGLQAGSPS